MTGRKTKRPPADAVVYSAEEVAKLLRIGRSTAYRALKAGLLPTLRVGPNRLVVPRAALEALLANPGAAAELRAAARKTDEQPAAK